MLKKIKSDELNVSINGILYKKADVDFFKQKSDAKKRAEKNAQSIIQKANKEASEIKSKAYSEGYSDGVQNYLNVLLTYMSETDEYIKKVRAKIFEDIQEMLCDLLDSPELLISCINKWLNETGIVSDKILVEIPLKYRHEESNIINMISRVWMGDIKIDYHCDEQILIHCGGRIAEFNPPDFVSKTKEILSEKYDFEIIENIKNISSDKISELERDS